MKTQSQYGETAAPCTAVSEEIVKDVPLSVPLHKNNHISDYLENRVFSHFKIHILKDRVEFETYDSTILEVLAYAKIIKQDDEVAELDVGKLLPKRALLRKAARDKRYQYEGEIIEFNEALNSIHSFSDPEVLKRLAEGMACYTDIPVLFPRGTQVVMQTPSGLLGGEVDSCTEAYSMFSRCYNLSVFLFVPTGDGCTIGKTTFKILEYDNKIPVDKLAVRIITLEEKVKLTERGKVFRKFTAEPMAASYIGNLTVPGWRRDYVICADGRVMTDSVNLAQFESDFYNEMMQEFSIDENASCGIVKDEDLWRCYTRIHGFSMRLKRWGWVDISGLNEVKWREDAFTQLVLEPKIKRTVLHLVKHYGGSFADFIEGKSGGLVFLLHGNSGVGKTLTAEAVADTLHRPLYSVSVGELGTDPNALESNLRSILDLAFQWNAVLLLDEADIFMEARDTNNIERNAMVSIFLRLLEYYSGVLFLTTNRVKSFDKAFFSRISLAISYPSLDQENRYKIWANILTSAGVDWHTHGINIIDVHKLAGYEVNGRNIKTAVRIAQTMASGDGRAMTTGDLEDILSLTEQFGKEIDIK